MELWAAPGAQTARRNVGVWLWGRGQGEEIVLLGFGGRCRSYSGAGGNEVKAVLLLLPPPCPARWECCRPRGYRGSRRKAKPCLGPSRVFGPFLGRGSRLGAEAGPGEASAHLLLPAASPCGLVAALAAFTQRGLAAGSIPGRCVAAQGAASGRPPSPRGQVPAASIESGVRGDTGLSQVEVPPAPPGSSGSREGSVREIGGVGCCAGPREGFAQGIGKQRAGSEVSGRQGSVCCSHVSAAEAGTPRRSWCRWKN